MDFGSDALERGPARRSMRLEEGRVGLVAARVCFRRVDEAAADVVGFFCGCGARVEADAEVGVLGLALGG